MISQTERSDDLSHSIRGTANIPLIADRLGMRITAYRGESSGFVDNVGSGIDDVNSDTTTQGRVALRAVLTPDLTIDASATYIEQEADGLPTGYLGLGDYQTSILWPEGYQDEMGIYNITANYDLGFADLSGSISHVSRQNFNTIGGNQYLLAAFLWGEVVGAQIQLANDIEETDIELRLTSNQDQRLRWSIGAFHQDQTRRVWQFDPSDDFDARLCALFGAPTGCYSSLDDGSFAADTDFSGLQNLQEQQTAIFGEVAYDLTDRLTATVGLRYFEWEQDFDLFFGGFLGVQAPGTPLTTTDSASTDGVNPRFVLSYDVTDDVMIYGEAARGFRYGGVNQPLPLTLCAADLAAAGLANGPATFGADSLWSYALGERGQFLDGRLTFNATAYMIDWSDVQSKQVLPSCFYYFIQNEGEVRSTGLEIESRLHVTDTFTLGANLSLTDSQANGDIPNLGAEDGDRAPYFPRYIANINGRYVYPFSASELIFEGDWTFRGDALTRFAGDDPTMREIPASDFLSFSATYRQDNWELGLFGQNLTNNTEILLRGPDTYAPFQPGDTVTWARPRTIGVRFKVSM
jgi:outer membrane receptor protein involved in Fe transport